MSAIRDLKDARAAAQSAHPGPIARARALKPLLEAAAPRIEAARELPPDVLEALHANAMFRTLLPRSFGGEETPPHEYIQVTEAIASADASTAWCIGQASGCSMAAAYMKPEIAREIWGPPDAVVAWGAQYGDSIAEVVDGGYRVTGTWHFASGGRHATWFGGHCHVRERDGSLRPGPDGAPLERTMMFRAGVAPLKDVWHVVGLRGTGSDSYSVKDLFVPDDYTVCRDTDAERREFGPLYRFTTTNLYASGFAGVALGIARAMLDSLIALATKKTPRITARMLRDSPVLQHQVAECETKLRSARAFLVETLRDAWDVAERTGDLPADNRVLIRLASTSAIHAAKAVAEVAYHEAGATAIFENNPFERRMRDIHAVSQQLQARTAHLELCGQHFLGLPTKQRFL
jgi:alkylation response protein AidB-like acyl-CoA dehydrogenase